MNGRITIYKNILYIRRLNKRKKLYYSTKGTKARIIYSEKKWKYTGIKVESAERAFNAMHISQASV